MLKLKSRLVIAGHIGYPLERIDDETNPNVCIHMEYCSGQKYSMKCNFRDSQNNCQLKRYYDRYGAEALFVGSKL